MINLFKLWLSAREQVYDGSILLTKHARKTRPEGRDASSNLVRSWTVSFGRLR
jgi:hypothetical protein